MKGRPCAWGNAALAAAAVALKERHLRYHHRVHAATRRHSLRLGRIRSTLLLEPGVAQLTPRLLSSLSALGTKT